MTDIAGLEQPWDISRTAVLDEFQALAPALTAILDARVDPQSHREPNA